MDTSRTQADSSVLATYRLPFAIAFDQECSGFEAHTRIGRMDVRVVLPELTWVDDILRVDAPPVDAPESVLDLGDVWGEAANWDPVTRAVDGWWAKGLLFVADAGALGPDGATEGLFAALGPWTQRLATWIEATIGQDAGRLGALRNVTVGGEGLAVWVDGDLAGTPRTAPEVVVLSRTGATLDGSTWETILREVGEGSEVPEEHVLLSDARAWLRRDDHRRAIIDAAAAAELVLTEILDWKLAAAPPAVENQFPLERRTLASLNALLAPLVPISKERLDRLVLIRNAVMHKPYNASFAEASDVVTVAEELVALIYPIDALLGR